ncbi:hypothetical protein L3i20_v245640 [Paenibacillus sp. L3-i20]|nr:hypothetical protein L3i20_v245640 [Paenibacillus sp. L3-i20]
MERCGYPDCRSLSIGTFSLVPLCQTHMDTIRTESKKWFTGGRNMSYETARVEYLQIADQIPWSQPMLDLKYGR